MKKTILLLALTCGTVSLAQVPVVTTSNEPYVAITGGTPIVFINRFLPSPDTDEGSAPISLPFPFTFMGTAYTQVHVDTNGFVSLGSPCSAGCITNAAQPAAAAPNAIIAGFWDDLDFGSASYTSSSSEVVIQWTEVQRFASSANRLSMQIRIQSSGSVVIHHGPMVSGAGFNGSVGFENATGSLGVNLFNGCTTACNNTNWVENRKFTIGEPEEADLVVPIVTISNVVALPSNDLTFDLQGTIRNVGRTAAPADGGIGLLWKAYLSTDRVKDVADQEVASGGPISVGATSSVNIMAQAATTTPLDGGAYYVLIEADSAGDIAEATEGNNVGSTVDQLVAGVDLVARSISGPTASGGGNSITVQINFNNRGIQPAGLVNYKIRLSTDNVFDLTDFTAYTGSSMVSGGETINESVTFTLPASAPSGDLFYVLQVDSSTTIVESSETNNGIASTGKVTISRANLIAELSDVVDVVTGISTRVGRFGESIRITGNFRNAGGANANNFKAGAVLSTDAQLSLLSDKLLCENLAPNALGPSASQQVTLNCTLPLVDAQMMPFPSGNYFVFFVIDSTGAVFESNEGDNTLTMGPFRFTAPGVDLAPTALTAPSVAGVGEVIPVTRSLRNLGNVDSPTSSYRYYASANQIVTTDDIPLKIVDPSNGSNSDEGSVTLMIGQSDTATELLRFPGTMPPGQYYVGCLVDPTNQIVELDEANNGLSSRIIQVAGSSLKIVSTVLPDATVGRPYNFRMAANGESGPSKWTLDSAGVPSWLRINMNDGTLSGLPTLAGGPEVVAVTVLLENANRQSAARVAFRVLPSTAQLAITTTAIPAVINNSSATFQFQFGAAGGVRPYVWRVVSGVLPAGVTLNADGLLSGAPRGVMNPVPIALNIEVKDATGSRFQKSYSMRLVAPGGLAFTQFTLPDGLVGQEYFRDLNVQNTDLSTLSLPVKFGVLGALPEGLAISPAADLLNIAGKPRRAGLFTFTLTVDDASGRSESMDFTILVHGPRYRLAFSASPSEFFTPGAQVTANFSATPTGSVVYRLASGTLPPGLELAADGSLTGTIAETGSEGTFSFVVEALDANGMSGLGSFGMRVERIPKSTGCSSTGDLSFFGLIALALLALRKAPKSQWVFASMLAISGFASAQSYQVVGPSGSIYQALGSGGLPQGQTTTQSATIMLPFSFPFFDTQITSVEFSTSGYLAVGGASSTDTSNENVPHSIAAAASAAAFIAPWWDTMVASPSGVAPTFRYAFVGSSPNRIAYFEWNNVVPGTAAAGPKISFQAQLYETTGQIRFAYSTTSPGSASASIGIQRGLGMGTAGATCALTGACGVTNYPAGQNIDLFLPPDLEVGTLSAPQSVYAGVPVQLTATVTNRGGREATNVEINFVFSADAVFGAGDQVIGTGNAPTVGAGASAQVTASPVFLASAMPGTGFLFAIADPNGAIPERIELNNTSSAVPVIIGVPTADLVSTAFSAPTVTQPGATLMVTRSFKNNGNADSQAYKYTYFVSDNQVVSISDRAITPVRSGAALMVGATDTATESVTLPSDLASGNYWLGVCVNYDAGVSAFGGGEISIVNNCFTYSSPVQVSTGAVAVVTSALPMVTQYAPFGLRLQASGGNGVYSWTVTGGQLPIGLSLNAVGEISGSPAVVGSFTFEVTATSGMLSGTKSLSLSVVSGMIPLVVVDQTLPAAEFGRAYRTSLIALGGKPPYTWSIGMTSELPIGLALSPDGSIEGRAVSAGDKTFEVQVKDSAGKTVKKELLLKVVTPTSLSVVTTALGVAYVGRDYLQQLVAVGGRSPYSWSVTSFQQIAESPTEPPGMVSNALPAQATFGLLIEDGIDDFMRGAPKQAGLFRMTLKVTDSNGIEDSANVLLQVSYREGLAITTTSLPDAFVNQTYEAILTHNGGRAAVGAAFAKTCILTSTTVVGKFECVPTEATQSLPAGLELAKDGKISGSTTAEVGTYSFLVKLTDDSGRQDVRSVSIRVRPDFANQKDPASCSAAGSSLFIGLLAVIARRRQNKAGAK